MIFDGIPDLLPTKTADRAIQTWQDLGLGELMVQMQIEFDGRLDAERLERALQLALDAEPVLGCRFVMHPRLPYWERLGPDERKNFEIAGDAAAFTAFRNRGPDAFAGPQLAGCLWRADAGDRLLLKVNHHASDAGGVKDTAAVVAAMYNSLGADSSFAPMPNVNGSRSYTQVSRQLPLRAYPRLAYNFIRILRSNTFPAVTNNVAWDENKSGPTDYTLRHIPAARVARMAAAGRVCGATLNDVMCTALLRAVMVQGQWDGSARLRLGFTVDLRRWYLPGGRAGAVCNLSSYDYINLGVEPGANFEDTRARVAAITRRRKKDWFGIIEPCLHPLLRSFSYPRLTSFFRYVLQAGERRRNFAPVITNMGPIEPETITFGGLRPTYAFLLVPPIFPPLFGCGLSGCAGGLTLSAGSPTGALPAINDTFDCLISELPR